MGILINDSQIGGGTTSNSFHNIGEIFYTMRTDTILNGAVECDGSQYNFTDFPDIENLLENNQLPYITINEFDSQVESTGICGKFGYGNDGANTSTSYFKVPKLSNIFIESGTKTNIGNYIEAGLPNITATLPADDYNTYGWAGAFYEGSTVNPATRHLESMSGQYHPVYFDASRCSSIYGNSTTVQPPAVLYRTMIQLKN